MVGHKIDNPASTHAAMDDDTNMSPKFGLIETPHNKKLYDENQKLKKLLEDYADYYLTPRRKRRAPIVPGQLVTRALINAELSAERTEPYKRRMKIKAQVAVVRALYTQSVRDVRGEKLSTADSRYINDMLLLQLQNLKYEEHSLAMEISACENYDHAYKKLDLIPVEEFLELFPEHKDSSEHDLMIARIEYEHQSRVKLEEQRQEKLKHKQMLIAQVKKGKDDIVSLDAMLEKFHEVAKPIKKKLELE